MSWPKNKGINRHDKQKRGTAVCSAGKEVSMEKKRNRQKRISKKISKKRNIAAAFILAGMIAVIVMVAVAARTKNGHITGFIQRADYMKGEIEAVSSVDAVYDEDTVWQTEEQMLLKESMIEQTEIYEKENNENAEEEKTGVGTVKAAEKEESFEREESFEKEKSDEKEAFKAAAARSKSYKKLDVKCVLQNPELPTGCEITALTIVLNYLGYDVDKLTLADNFLDKGRVGETSPYKAFVGNPRDEDACGAFAPVIVNSAKRYLYSENSDMNVYNVTGADYSELVDYVDNGHPVLVWETMWMAKPHIAAEWNVDGETIVWKSHEHAMVLIGYTADTYIMADPLRGIYEYDKEVVEERYKDMGRQAIVIY